jgi:hypothetical protein
MLGQYDLAFSYCLLSFCHKKFCLIPSILSTAAPPLLSDRHTGSSERLQACTGVPTPEMMKSTLQLNSSIKDGHVHLGGLHFVD